MSEVRTARLRLSPVDEAGPDELAAVAAVWGDPGTWGHLPSGRPADDTWVAGWVARHARSRALTGLGWWLLRLDVPVGALDAGTVIGAGGCSVLDDIEAWNLGYRLTPAAWGYGLATELAVAAVAAAHEARPDMPVIARVLEGNPASWRVQEKIGMSLAWSGPVPSDEPYAAGLMRRIYADRELSEDMLASLIQLEQVDRR